MKRKIYLETSVISYLTARPSKTIIGAAHQQITLAWWELRDQYAGAAQKRLAMVSNVPLLTITEQAVDIAEALVTERIVPAKAAEDALHIAIATINRVDYLLTWNCKHIANPEIQRNIARHLEKMGLFLPFICTPEELLGEDNAE
jgi:predicted nucleic acid-binding protein